MARLCKNINFNGSHFFMCKFYFKKSKRAIKPLRLALGYFSHMAAVFLWLNLILGHAEEPKFSLTIPNICFDFFYGELTILSAVYLQSPLI